MNRKVSEKKRRKPLYLRIEKPPVPIIGNEQMYPMLCAATKVTKVNEVAVFLTEELTSVATCRAFNGNVFLILRTVTMVNEVLLFSSRIISPKIHAHVLK